MKEVSYSYHVPVQKGDLEINFVSFCVRIYTKHTHIYV